MRDEEGTPGLTRRVAFEPDGHWFGHVEASPETMSGWHHHGDDVTPGYVLRGKVTLEFGPGGRDHVGVDEGEYFEVPKYLVHREATCRRGPAGSFWAALAKVGLASCGIRQHDRSTTIRAMHLGAGRADHASPNAPHPSRVGVPSNAGGGDHFSAHAHGARLDGHRRP